MGCPVASGGLAPRTLRDAARLLGPIGRDVRVTFDRDAIRFGPASLDPGADDDPGELRVEADAIEGYRVETPGSVVLGSRRLEDFSRVPLRRQPVTIRTEGCEVALDIRTDGHLTRTMRSREAPVRRAAAPRPRAPERGWKRGWRSTPPGR